MKSRTCLQILTLLILIYFLPTGYAEDYMRWHLPDGAKLRIGKGRISGDIAISPDNSILAVATTIGIWLYDVQTGTELDLLSMQAPSIAGVTFSPDGTTLASGSSDNTLLLWDVNNRVIKAEFIGHTDNVRSIVFSPDGKTIASSTGRNDKTVLIWDVASGDGTSNSIIATGEISSLAFTPDGKTLATGSKWKESLIELWDVATGNLKTTYIGHTGDINDLAFSPNGKVLASCAGFLDNTIRIWDTVNNELITTITGHTQGVNSIAFSVDGRTLVSGGNDGTIVLWDVPSYTYKTTLLEHSASLISLVFSSDGKTLVSGSLDGTVIIWNVDSLQPKRIISGHVPNITCLALNPNNKTLVTGGWDRKIRILDTMTGEGIYTLTGHFTRIESVDFSPDGRTVVSSSSYDDPTVRLWDAENGSLSKLVLGYTNKINKVKFSPDGKILASAGDDDDIYLYHTVTGNNFVTLTDFTNKPHNDPILSLAFTPDGNILASGDSHGKIRLWSLITFRLIKEYTGHSNRIKALEFSPNGRMLASGGAYHKVILWDIASDEQRILPDSPRVVSSITFSPDGKTVIAGGNFANPSLFLWDVKSVVLQQTLSGHTSEIVDVSISSDGETLVSGSIDGTILLWEYNSIVTPTYLETDVNGDGVVDIYDLIAVAANFGKTGPNNADVNGDGIVNIADLIKIAAELGNAAAPSVSLQIRNLPISSSDVEQWITQVQSLDSNDPTYKNGILFLEQLLTALIPNKTALLPNYPNPFNPETWIPYQLSEAADVTIKIYSTDGLLIKNISLGHKQAGLYQDRTHAAYWDGKNELGEPVASGIYFYEFSTGHYSATKRMVIRK
ncbi:hypothetical protein C6497_11535 [Candidatus Poribacteria bacterium]|nr:MAG: hypothetical protein C6497_11535 [Candidatus Poribacteria bacterium]